jgi:hypothetical protein
MLLASPVCHLHYFCLSVPLISAVFAIAWEGTGSPRLGPTLGALVAANLVANTLPHFPGMEIVRDIGLAGYSGVLLIGVAVGVLWSRRVRRSAAAPTTSEAPSLKAAA